MDLAGAEKANKVLSHTQAGALAFFLLAGALLMASLLMPSPSPLSEGGQVVMSATLFQR